MGAEKTRWVRDKGNKHGRHDFVGDPFWQDDVLRKKYCGQSSKARIVVLGGGDGALQDTMRCLFDEPTPLETINLLLDSSSYVQGTLERVYIKILAIEQQHAASQSWVSEGGTAQELSALHKAYLRIIQSIAKDRLIRTPLLKMLRKDVEIVHLVIRDSSLGEAYSLNRFLILLVNECQKLHTEPGAVNLKLIFNAEVTRICGNIPKLDIEITKAGTAPVYIRGIMHMSVRFGVDADSAPGQQIGISYQDSTNRRELATIPQPLFPLD